MSGNNIIIIHYNDILDWALSNFEQYVSIKTIFVKMYECKQNEI